MPADRRSVPVRPALRLHGRARPIAGLCALVLVAAPASTALAAVCYQLPFNNPNLDDGWGSLCCGRTSPHRGVDFPQASGTAIPSVAAGTVVVNTWSSCLGNVVVVQHGDGMYSGYSHMLVPSPLGPGTVVSQGQQVGQVGNTGSCSKGAHLHLTMSAAQNGYYTGTTVDPYVYIKDHLTCNDPPKGSIDTVDCGVVEGWTQDPSAPEQAIATRIYFDGDVGDPNATLVEIPADLARDDLCQALGSCNHGFRVPTPLSLLDGAAHVVHAYGIDSEGDKNTQLGNSPGVLTCPPPPLLGWRRSVALPHALAAWQFSTFADLVTIADPTLAALGQTIALPPAPLLVRADDGSPTVWLVDGPTGDLRREVASPTIAGAWHLDLDAAAVWPAADIAAIPEGPPLRPRPILVQGSGPEIFVIDDNLDPAAAGSDSGDTSDATTGSGPETTTTVTTTTGEPLSGSGEGTAGVATEAAGCGCRGADRPGAWLGAVVLLLLAPRRRRSLTRTSPAARCAMLSLRPPPAWKTGARGGQRPEDLHKR